MIQALLFDLGNVLIDIDWMRGSRKLAGKTFDADGKPHAAEDIFKIIDPNNHAAVWDEFGIGKFQTLEFLTMMADKMKFNESHDDIKIALNEIFEPLPERVRLFNDYLSRPDLKTAMVSDTNEMHIGYIENYIPSIFENLSCEKRFYSYSVGHMKKFGHEFYQYVLDAIGVKPENALMIDDSIKNKDGADKIGLNFLHIQKDEDLKAALKKYSL